MDNNQIQPSPIQSTEIPIPQGSTPTDSIASESNSGLKKILIIGGGIILIIVLIIAGILFYKNLQNQQITKEVTALGQSAQTDYNNGDYKSAEQKLYQALSLSTKFPSLYASIIQTIAQEGNLSGQEVQSYNRAQPYITKALSLYPNNGDVILAVGYISETAGKYAPALNYYNKAIAVDPKNSQAWFHKGHDLEFLGQQKNAFAAYDKAYSLNPKDPLIVLAKGREAASRGDGTDALKYFQQTASLPTVNPPTKSEALTDEAVIEQGNILHLATAISLAKQATIADPTYAPAEAEYGFLLSFNGDLVDGVKDIQTAIKLNPRISQNYYFMGLALRGGKYYKDAVNFFIYALGKVDNDNTLLTAYDKNEMKAKINYDTAKTYSLLNDDVHALQYVKTAIQLDPSYKSYVKNDIKYNFFQGLILDKTFKSLINS